MNILDKIVARKIEEVKEAKAVTPVPVLERRPLFDRQTISARDWVSNPAKSGIIAEFKRKSPSKGLINGHSTVAEVAQGYQEAGVSAMSVLTDVDFFGGSVDNLLAARSITSMPLLRKDFVIDEYQLYEAKSIGADFVLLIAACLTPGRLLELAVKAHELGLQVLMEVHSQEELESHLNTHLDLVGVNNRNLKTFEVSLETSRQLAAMIPDEFVKVSESGISHPDSIKELKQYGYQGFLIGENFMKTDRPGDSCQLFINQL